MALGHTRRQLCPLLQSVQSMKGTPTMDSDSNQKFSDYLVMKRTNPNLYWTKDTHEQMTKAYQHYGKAFFDIYDGLA